MSEQMVCQSMERSVDIEITNKTHDVTLHSPRSYCFSGHSSKPPCPRIPPGATESCQFTNSTLRFRGSVGLLVYEADTFTLAILFSNPFDYNIFYMELAVEISMDKVHLGNLETIYKRMYNNQPTSTGNETMLHRVKLGAHQEPVMVSAGHVKVTAAMSNTAKSIIRVVVENREGSTA